MTNLQLTCPEWGEVGLTGLFNIKLSEGRAIENGVFTIRPHLTDMDRLDRVANHPRLSLFVKHVRVFVCDTNLDQLRTYVILFLLLIGQREWSNITPSSQWSINYS